MIEDSNAFQGEVNAPRNRNGAAIMKNDHATI
jgi:hypothetical protein